MTREERAEIEHGVLSLIAYNPVHMPEVFAELFTEPAHRRIFSALADEYERTRPALDIIAAGRMAGIRAFDMTEATSARSTSASYIHALKDMWISDTYAAAYHRLANVHGIDQHVALQQTAEDIAARLNLARRTEQPFSEWLDSTATLHTTGIHHIDNALGGFAEGEVVVIAGRPGTGKTSMGCTLAVNMVQRGTPVDFHSFEMRTANIWQFIVARMSMQSPRPVTITDIRRRSFDRAQRDMLVAYHNELSQYGLTVLSSAGQDVGQLAAAIETSRAPVHIVDHLGHVAVNGAKSIYERVTRASNQLIMAAKRSGKTVIELVQLKRTGDGRPGMSDLRDSGHIEQDADTIIFLHEPERELNLSRGLTVVDIELIIDKAREGQAGFVSARINRPYAFVHTDAPARPSDYQQSSITDF